MRDYRDLRRVYNLSLTGAFFALLEQKVLDVWETLARMGYGKSDWFDFAEPRWKALPVERQIAYASQYQKWYAERLGVGVEHSFDGSVFRLIPPGHFVMGVSTAVEEGCEYEIERYASVPRALWVGRYPVTQEEFERIFGDNPSAFLSVIYGPNHPVNRVSWYQAQDYCNKSGTQLLKEKEWEYACRSGTTTDYLFGTNPDLLKEYAWYERNSNNQTHPVGEKKANAWGLQDMIGNVWEWCEEKWVGDDKRSVSRGGGYNYSEWAFRSGTRSHWYRSHVGNDLGFRVCRLFS